MNEIFSSATLILTNGEDEIIFQTNENITDTHVLFKQKALFKVRCQADYGKTWLAINFPGILFTTVDARSF